MTPADLHTWLVARWQEKLDTARAATPGPWNFDPAPDGGWYIESARDPDVRDIAEHVDAIHIAAFDPAFAIAVCEAALRRLARHAPSAPLYGLDGIPGCSGCGVGKDDDWRYVWPCPEVLDDAAPWATRDDFPEELRRG